MSKKTRRRTDSVSTLQEHSRVFALQILNAYSATSTVKLRIILVIAFSRCLLVIFWTPRNHFVTEQFVNDVSIGFYIWSLAIPIQLPQNLNVK